MLKAYHITLVLCSTGCVLSSLAAQKSNNLQNYYVCSNGVCPSGVFTDYMQNTFNVIFIATLLLAVTFGYDAAASLVRTAGYSLAFEKTMFAKLLMFATHLANVVLSSIVLGACNSNKLVFNSSYTSAQGSAINLVKLYGIAIFVIGVGSSLFHHAVHVSRGHAAPAADAARRFTAGRDHPSY